MFTGEAAVNLCDNHKNMSSIQKDIKHNSFCRRMQPYEKVWVQRLLSRVVDCCTLCHEMWKTQFAVVIFMESVFQPYHFRNSFLNWFM